MDSGILVLSRHPFDKVEKEIYVSRGGIDRFACKGVIMVRVTINGTDLDVYATHMQSGPASKTRFEREEQVEQLADFINLHSGSESKRNVIVAGDMNMGPLTNMNLYNWAYENQEDKELRTAAYLRLKELAHLEDVIYDHPYWQQDINRFLGRNVKGIVRNIGKPIAKINGIDMLLSDSERYLFLAELNVSPSRD